MFKAGREDFSNRALSNPCKKITSKQKKNKINYIAKANRKEYNVIT
jgi:hypothetical protein